MAIHETARLNDFGDSARNYLYDWARRTGNVENLGAFTVDVRQDMSTGFLYGDIVDAAEEAPVEVAAPSVASEAPELPNPFEPAAAPEADAGEAV